MSGVGELNRHNFPEVVASRGRGYHYFRELVPIMRAGNVPISCAGNVPISRAGSASILEVVR
jgi:hypothetical protein